MTTCVEYRISTLQFFTVDIVLSYKLLFQLPFPSSPERKRDQPCQPFERQSHCRYGHPYKQSQNVERGLKGQAQHRDKRYERYDLNQHHHHPLLCQLPMTEVTGLCLPSGQAAP